jgi:hypothetical protein
MSILEELRTKLTTLKQKFIDGGQVLAKVKLGWFNNQQ